MANPAHKILDDMLQQMTKEIIRRAMVEMVVLVTKVVFMTRLELSLEAIKTDDFRAEADAKITEMSDNYMKLLTAKKPGEDGVEFSLIRVNLVEMFKAVIYDLEKP